MSFAGVQKHVAVLERAGLSQKREVLLRHHADGIAHDHVTQFPSVEAMEQVARGMEEAGTCRVGDRVAFILDDGAPVEPLEFRPAKAVPPKTRHAGAQRAGPDDGAPQNRLAVQGERERYPALGGSTL